LPTTPKPQSPIPNPQSPFLYIKLLMKGKLIFNVNSK